MRPARLASTVSATTATPNGSDSTWVTPLIFLTSSALTLSTFTPSIGACSSEA